MRKLMKCPQCNNYMQDYKFDHSEALGSFSQHYCQDCKRIEITKDDTMRLSNPIRDKRMRAEAERAMLIARHEQKQRMIELEQKYVRGNKPVTDNERKAYEKQREALGQLSARRMADEKARYMALRRHEQADMQRGKAKLHTDTDPNSETFGQRIKNGLVKKPNLNQGQLARIPNAVLGGLGTVGNGKSPMITPNPNNSKYSSNPSFNPFITGKGKSGLISGKKNQTKIIRQGGKYAIDGTPQHEHTNNPTNDDLGSNEDLKIILDDKEFVKELEKSGVDTKALNKIKERLRKKLNGELDEEKNRIPRYSEIED